MVLMRVFEPVKEAFSQFAGFSPGIALGLSTEFGAALNPAGGGCFLAPAGGGREGETAAGKIRVLGWKWKRNRVLER